MGWLIGMDEAGLGPNLGPLVVTATKWQVPGSPREFDLWNAMADIATQQPATRPDQLQIADSKQVYAPGKGLAALEKSVLSALRMLGHSPTTLAELTTAIQLRTRSPNPCGLDDIQNRFDRSGHNGHNQRVATEQPLWLNREINLSTEVDASLIADIATKWDEYCQRSGVKLTAICSEIVQPARFNELVRAADNKSLALSRLSLNLLRSVWDPDDKQPTLVICDKHGGRNRYDDLLAEVLDDRMIFTVGESRERSVYRVGPTELRFQMKAEANFPVALASIVCKYVRELSMHAFNQFWAEHIPGLKPTAGYPVDAVRFKADIAETQQKLGIANDTLWRER